MITWNQLKATDQIIKKFHALCTVFVRRKKIAFSCLVSGGVKKREKKRVLKIPTGQKIVYHRKNERLYPHIQYFVSAASPIL